MEASKRQRLFNKIAYGDWDAVIIPQSFLDFIPDDPEREKAYIRERIAELQDVLNEVDDGRWNNPVANDVKKSIEALEEQLINVGKPKTKKVKDIAKSNLAKENKLIQQATRRKDDVRLFEKMGVDALFVDEAHAYKKLGFATALSNIKGIDTKGSKRAFGLQMKIQFIHERMNGRNVVLSTGTPITNTMAEVWTMMKYINPGILSKHSIDTFDKFAATFGAIEPSLEFTAAGRFKIVKRFKSYKNAPELMRLFRACSYVVLTEDVPEFKADNTIPKLKDGKHTQIIMPQTPDLQRQMEDFKQTLERWEKLPGKEKRLKRHVPVVIFGRAKQAAIDLRLINSSNYDDPGSKTNIVIKEVKRIYDETTKYKGAQLIFSDMYQSPDVGKGIERFNLYEDMKQKLIRLGIPSNEIEVISDQSGDKREQIFDRVNKGDIRIVMGSTERLGTGVNVQTLLKAIHHIDAPVRPMDFEQRNGRIMRQGNDHAQMNLPVEIVTYGVEKTLDATAYQRLDIKLKFINQMMKGEGLEREAADAASEEAATDMTFSQMMATLSGSQFAMMHVAKMFELKKLQTAKRSFERSLIEAKKGLNSSRTLVEYLSDALKDAKKGVEIIKSQFVPLMSKEDSADLVSGLDIQKISINGKVFKDKIIENLNAALEKEVDLWKNASAVREVYIKINDIPTLITALYDPKVSGKFDLKIEPVPEGSRDSILTGTFTSASGLFQSLRRNIRTYVEEKIPAIEKRLAVHQKDIPTYEATLQKKFDKDPQLANLEREVAELELKMQGESAPAKEEPGELAPAGDIDIDNIEYEAESGPGDTSYSVDTKAGPVKVGNTNIVRAQISALSEEFNTPVIVVETKEDLPEAFKEDAKRIGIWNDRITGLYGSGNVYVVLDALSQGYDDAVTEARKVILHEVVAHKGLPAMLGDKAYDNLLDDIYDSIPEYDRRLLEYDYNTKDKRTIAKEYLADMAENDVNPSLLQRILAKIREAIRKLFGISYSENDVYDMLRRSADNLRKQKRANAEFAGEYLEGGNTPNILYNTNKSSDRFAGDWLEQQPDILSNADQRYNTPIEKRTLKEKLDELRRGLKDVHLPIRRFEEAIKKLGGVLDDRSKPYRDINLAFERLDYLYNQFMKNKFNPINKAVAAIRKSGIPAGEVLPYIIAKRATELNPKMRQKEIDEWITSRNERDEAKRKAFIKANPKISAERMTKYELKLLEDMEEDKSKFIDSVKDKDYSGVMPFDYDKNGQPRGNYTNPEELAKDIVAEFEKKAGNDLTDNLWKSIREATGEILNIWERGSQLSPEDKAEYEKSQYYVPLRGWRFGAAKSLVYTRGEGFSKSLKHAEGRSSLADNPLAYIEKIAFTAIQEQVGNEVNNSMANLIIKNLNIPGLFNMAVLRKVYYVKQPDGTTMYTIDRPSEDLFANKLAEAKTYTEHENLRPKSAALEHEVTIVRRPAGDLAIIFKDDYLQVAQALNKQNYMLQLLSDKVIDTRTKGKMLSLMSKATNILKANLTQWNVVFPFTNHLRDSQEGPVTQYIKHGKPGLKTLGKYPSAYGALFRYIFTKPDLSKQMDRDVVDFYENGGATGYTHGRTVEDIEKQIEKDVSGMIHRGVIGKTLVDPVKTLLSGISFWNQFFEDASRLAVYRAAISMGMSKKDAAYESKEATINMNRKGLLSKQFDAWTAFFNVALEGTNKNISLAKHYPRRFAIVATGYMMLGYLNNLLWSMLGDDDDDLQYKNISPYMRQNYLTIPNPVAFFTGNKSNRYVSIPLAQFWRAFFAAGNISYDVMAGRMKAGEAFLYAGADMVNAVSPIDVGGFWVKGKFSIAPLVPTITRPVVEIYQNRDFLGNTIYKKPFTRALENYYADAGLGKKNANPAAKMLTDFLYATVGRGDKETYLEYRTNKKGDDKKIIELLDWNPSKIEHIFKGYLGGTGAFVSDLITTVGQGIGEEDIDFKNIPFINKFVRTIPEAKWAVIDQYYSNSDVFKRNEFSEGSAEKIADTTGDYENLSKIQTNEYRMEFQAIMSYYSKQITDTYKDYDFDYEAGNKMAVDLMTMANEEVSALQAKYGKK
jgi:hypothetical protein